MLNLKLRKVLKGRKVGKRVDTAIQKSVKKVLADANQSLIVMVRN